MRPYISIVVVGRNDNYGGDFLKRISTFARSLGRQVSKHPGLFELVVVEWNPPLERERLAKALDWPPSLNLRIITVPKDIHEQAARESQMPLLEFTGKNTGIRRARGDFVLITNADIIFADELIDVLAKRQLKQGVFYRVDRYDFEGSGIEKIATENLIDFAAKRVNFVHVRHGHDYTAPISMAISPHTNQAKWPKSAALPGDEVRAGGAVIECNNEETQMWGLHTNASGDFLLAARNDWFESRGFWERVDTFTHLDGFAVCRMKSIGLLQTLFLNPLCILHMDHSRVEQLGRPFLPWSEVHAELAQLRTDPLSLPYSHQTGWGLESFPLPELETWVKA